MGSLYRVRNKYVFILANRSLRKGKESSRRGGKTKEKSRRRS